jgi:2-(1,2-epoxy-1,2-dihydrophenyl)acetyl-CoA isomerase
MSAGLVVERRGGADWLILNRPERLNAFTWELRDELIAAVESCRRSDATALVLTGSGRAFCAGVDMATVLTGEAGASPEYRRQQLVRTQTLITALATFEKPTVAAVNGVVAGSGLSFAMAMRALVAVPGAWFHTAFLDIELVPDLGAMWFLPRRVGLARALNLMLRPRAVDAQEALAAGLIDYLVPEYALVERVERLLSGMHTS